MSRLIKIECFDKYFISDDGKVFSFKYGRKIELKQGKNTRGYPYVNLSKNGKYKSKSIHRLVAKAFIPNPESKTQVNHINGDKTNNRVENLEWSTPSQNMKHAFSENLNTIPLNSKLNENQVKSIKKGLLNGQTMNELSKMFCVSYSCIKNIKYNKSWINVSI